jgi:hemoglobin-like flavoprotein
MNTKPARNQQLQLLQQQISVAEPRAGLAMLVFWKNLFELNPTLRPLLGEKPGEEDYLLVQFLAAGLAPLFRQTPNITPADQDEACAPVNTDEEQQCSVVGEALLWSLEEAFGADFTPKVRSAWETLYRFITVNNRQNYNRTERLDFDTAIAAA